MHIAIVCRYLTEARGGHERYLKRLADALIARGCRVSVLSSDFDPAPEGAAGPERIRVPLHRFPQWRRYLSFNRNARRLVQERRDAFDIVLTTEYVTFGDVYRAGAGIARAEMQQRGRFVDRLSIKYHVKKHLQSRLMHNGPRRIIVNSESMRAQVLRFYDVPEERIALVYNGIDTDRFAPDDGGRHRALLRARHGLNDEDFVCLAAGADWRRKGIDRTVDAVRKLRDANVKLLVVGCDPRPLRRHIGPDSRHFIFTGPTTSIEHYYAASDLCIVASRYDPAPNVVLESLACALPVAVAAECGLTEWVSDGRCGCTFAGTEELADAIGVFLNLRATDSYRRMQRHARELGRTFTMERHVDELLHVLEAACRERTGERTTS